jgi:hypothetical protein
VTLKKCEKRAQAAVGGAGKQVDPFGLQRGIALITGIGQLLIHRESRQAMSEPGDLMRLPDRLGRSL